MVARGVLVLECHPILCRTSFASEKRAVRRSLIGCKLLSLRLVLYMQAGRDAQSEASTLWVVRRFAPLEVNREAVR